MPKEAAYEHHRLAAQSELVMLETSHFFVFSGEPDVRPTLADFWDRVERGEETTRATATADRVRLARAPFHRRTLPRWMGPALLTVGALLALATLVSEDLTSIGAGLLDAIGVRGGSRGRFAPLGALPESASVGRTSGSPEKTKK